MDERAGDQQPPAHAAGELVDLACRGGRRGSRSRARARSPSCRSARAIRYRCAKTSRFCSTVSVTSRLSSCGTTPHSRARRLRLARQPEAEHLELALVGDRLRGQQRIVVDLPGAVRAEQADARARRHVEVEPVDRRDRAVALDDAAQADGEVLAHAVRMPAVGLGALTAGSVAPAGARRRVLFDENAADRFAGLTGRGDVELDGQPGASPLRALSRRRSPARRRRAARPSRSRCSRGPSPR